jgi:hypothetical protein
MRLSNQRKSIQVRLRDPQQAATAYQTIDNSFHYKSKNKKGDLEKKNIGYFGAWVFHGQAHSWFKWTKREERKKERKKEEYRGCKV